MVDVSEKPATARKAVAEAFVEVEQETLTAIIDGAVGKGDVLTVAEMAGVMAAALLTLPGFCAAPARAQEDPQDESFREDLQETVEIYMVTKLKRALALTPEQERTVIPLIEQMNTARRDTNRQRRLLLMKLRPLVEDESSSDKEIAALMGNLEQLDGAARASEMKSREGIREALSPRQQARFVMFQERFRREMAERIRGMEPRREDIRRRVPPPADHP